MTSSDPGQRGNLKHKALTPQGEMENACPLSWCLDTEDEGSGAGKKTLSLLQPEQVKRVCARMWRERKEPRSGSSNRLETGM